jgi:uncharacterized membrane protein
MRSVVRFFRRKLLAGILVLVPIGVTYFVLKLIFNGVDNILAPYIENYLGRDIPGLGLVATVILVLLAGLLGTNVFGKHMLSYIDRGLSKIPIVAGIYVSAKQVVEAIGTANTKSFKRVVLVEYPRKGLLTLGFVTKDAYTVVGKDGTKKEVMNIFVPSTPNPTTGFLIIVQKSQVIGIDLTVEEGIKFVVSGGILAPSRTWVIDETGMLAETTNPEGTPGGPATTTG